MQTIKQLKPKQPKTEDLMFFAVLCEIMDFHRATFQADLTGQPKQDFNILNKMLQNFRTRILSRNSEAAKDYIDNTGAAAWEVMNEFMQAKDKKQFLAVVKCFNEGLIRLEGDTRPVNEVPFEEVLNKPSKGQAA